MYIFIGALAAKGEKKLRGSLSKYFIVSSPLTTKVISQNYLRIDSDRSKLADVGRPGQD